MFQISNFRISALDPITATPTSPSQLFANRLYCHGNVADLRSCSMARVLGCPTLGLTLNCTLFLVSLNTQRIHLALMRQAYRAMSSLAAEAGGKGGARAIAASSTFALPPSSSPEVRLTEPSEGRTRHPSARIRTRRGGDLKWCYFQLAPINFYSQDAPLHCKRRGRLFGVRSLFSVVPGPWRVGSSCNPDVSVDTHVVDTYGSLTHYGSGVVREHGANPHGPLRSFRAFCSWTSGYRR